MEKNTNIRYALIKQCNGMYEIRAVRIIPQTNQPSNVSLCYMNDDSGSLYTRKYVISNKILFKSYEDAQEQASLEIFENG